MGEVVFSNMADSKPISMIKSFDFWRKATGKDNFLDVELHLNENGYCSDCDNRGVINQKGVGLIRCICDLKYHESRFIRIKKELESIYDPKTFEEFVMWGDTATQTQSRALRDYVLEWVNTTSNWLVLQGNNGCGKSHLLQSVVTMLGPWALYLSMPDLEGWYFSAMKNDNGEMDFESLIEMVSRHPILILDDVGSENQSRFVMSATRKIIDFRYRMYTEFPTLMATNYDETALRASDRRIGDRVFDEVHNTIVRTPLASYRAKGNK